MYRLPKGYIFFVCYVLLVTYLVLRLETRVCRCRRSGIFYRKLKCYAQIKKRPYALGKRFLVNYFWRTAKYPSSLEER